MGSNLCYDVVVLYFVLGIFLDVNLGFDINVVIENVLFVCLEKLLNSKFS